jgi:hypothetical protein
MQLVHGHSLFPLEQQQPAIQVVGQHHQLKMHAASPIVCRRNQSMWRRANETRSFLASLAKNKVVVRQNLTY